ncbi:hypothetical protein H2201_008134 [Coniosporium apollinis]|uniref:Uncharacterized protein n=1 Tax=Coniosporium apollinis TaxID=61459 RepID=A0ABQ9NL86_9PEZI|nr:hypothetical protein H2201_008134 [Coniosporium apollinis]
MRIDRGIGNTTSRYSTQTLEACNAAPNCQISDGPFGLSIGFVPGEEPGSANYARHFRKRSVAVRDAQASEPVVRTNLDMVKEMTNYGTIYPYHALDHLKETCNNFCGPDDVELGLKAHGQYDGSDGDQERDNFIEALKAQVAQGVKTKVAAWDGMVVRDDCAPSQQDEHHQSRFVSVNRFVDDNLQGFISVEVQHSSEDDGNCERVFDALTAAAGAINGIAGGFFGLLKNMRDAFRFIEKIPEDDPREWLRHQSKLPKNISTDWVESLDAIDD